MLFEVSKTPAPEVAKQLAASKLMCQWESTSRLYYNYFENRKEAYFKSLDNLLVSPFTKYRLFSHWFDYYQKIACFTHQQLLGDITDKEIEEVNGLFNNKKQPYVHSNRNPAQLRVTKKDGRAVIGASFVIAIYAFFILKFNKLWLGLPLVTSTLVRLTQDYRQPYQKIINAFRYIEEKRAASVWYDLKQSEVNTKLVKGKGMDSVKEYLGKQRTTVLEMEQDVAKLVAAELAKKK